MDRLNPQRREVQRELRKVRRDTSRLGPGARILSGSERGTRDRDSEPPRMLSPGGHPEVTTLRGGLEGVEPSSSRGSGALLPGDPGRGTAGETKPPIAKYGVLQPSGGRGMTLQRGPVSMLSRRHDRPQLRDYDQARMTRNRVLFLLILGGMAALVIYHFVFR